MSKKGLAKDVVIILLLLMGVYLVVRYSDPIRNTVTGFMGTSMGSVKGTSTKRGAEVTASLKEDLANQLENVKKQSMNVKIGDIVNGVSRTKKIIHDMSNLKDYTQAQIKKILSSK